MRDLAIQKRENDLVVGDLRPRLLRPRRLLAAADGDARDARARRRRSSRSKTALVHRRRRRSAAAARRSTASRFFTAPNPPFGAVFTYYLKDEIKTQKEGAAEGGEEARQEGQGRPLPAWEELRAEEREEEPAVLLTVTDADGNVVRRLERPGHAGLPRVAWDLRYLSSTADVAQAGPGRRPVLRAARGPAGRARDLHGLAREARGRRGHPVRRAADVRGRLPGLGRPLKAADTAALLAFEKKTARLQRAVLGAVETAEEAQGRLALVKKALDDTPGPTDGWGPRRGASSKGLEDLLAALHGDKVMRVAQRADAAVHGGRVEAIVSASGTATLGADRHQPRGLRDRRPRRSRASWRRCGRSSTRDLRALEASMEKARRALDAGPGAGVDEGVANRDGHHCRSSTAGRGALGRAGVIAGSGAEAGVAASSAR